MSSSPRNEATTRQSITPNSKRGKTTRKIVFLSQLVISSFVSEFREQERKAQMVAIAEQQRREQALLQHHRQIEANTNTFREEIRKIKLTKQLQNKSVLGSDADETDGKVRRYIRPHQAEDTRPFQYQKQQPDVGISSIKPEQKAVLSPPPSHTQSSLTARAILSLDNKGKSPQISHFLLPLDPLADHPPSSFITAAIAIFCFLRILQFIRCFLFILLSCWVIFSLSFCCSISFRFFVLILLLSCFCFFCALIVSLLVPLSFYFILFIASVFASVGSASSLSFYFLPLVRFFCDFPCIVFFLLSLHLYSFPVCCCSNKDKFSAERRCSR